MILLFKSDAKGREMHRYKILKGRRSNMQKMWLPQPQAAPKPVKMSLINKEWINAKVQRFIEQNLKMRQSVNRFEVKAGRIYLYQLVEQYGWDDPKAQWIKPLIDGKYAEYIFARITIYDTKYQSCTAGWQRHNGQWFVLCEGTLDECLEFVEKDCHFFA